MTALNIILGLLAAFIVITLIRAAFFTAPKPQRENRPDFRPGGNRSNPGPRTSQNQSRQSARPAPVPNAAPKTADQLFEEKLKAFMSESDSKISSIKQYSEHRTKSRRR